jgi:hypothetical protein
VSAFGRRLHREDRQRSRHVPDHGDFGASSGKVLSSANGSLTMLAEGFSLPLALKRTITLTQTEKGYRLHADYQGH